MISKHGRHGAEEVVESYILIHRERWGVGEGREERRGTENGSVPCYDILTRPMTLCMVGGLLCQNAHENFLFHFN